ncbi:hypothetical protein [Paracoccus sp. N5]|uniref:hypothetical protein n=1 Tax=Paracoccus sp. N5 TaxID=1101189 RepID=UPI000377CF90|nr:hypothetical protein [Paracoccus sp. N5]
MNRPFRFALLLALAGSLATPALADRDRDRDREWNRHHGHHHKHDDHRNDRRDGKRHEARRGCPGGLVWYRGECLRKERVQRLVRYRPGIGDVFNPGQYQRIADPRLYALQQGQNWNYYRDDNQIYRVDSKTQRVLAVMQLLQALSN